MVQKCNKKTCGRFYHIRCMTNNYRNYELYSRTIASNNNSTTNEDDDDEEEVVVTFTCPSHFCDVCYEFYGNKTEAHSKGCLHRCIACPRSFHTNCIEPSARFNTMCILCPNHPEKALPSLDGVAPDPVKPSTKRSNAHTNTTNTNIPSTTSDMLFESCGFDIEPDVDNIILPFL